MNGGLLPGVGGDIVFAFGVRGDLVLPIRGAGRVHNPGIVAPVGQDERHIGIGQSLDLVYRAPRRHVVGDRTHREDRRADIAQRNRPAVNLEMSHCQGVVEEQAAKVFRVHAVGHAGGVGVPRHEVEHRWTLALEVAPYH